MKHKELLKNVTKKHLLIAGGVLLLLIAIIISAGFWLYSTPIGDSKIKVFKKLNLPVAKTGSAFIGGRELFSTYEIDSKIYGGKNGYEPSKSQSEILDRLIQISKLQVVAASRGVTVSDQEVNDEYNSIAEQEGGPEQLARTLADKYHFTVEDFKTKSTRPDVLKAKLAISFYGDKSLNTTLYQTLDTVNIKLSPKNDFGELAKTYSEDSATSPFGGDSGEIPTKDLAPELQAALKDTQPGDAPVTITTRFGIYIVKVLNRKQNGDKGETIHFQSIYLNYGKIDAKVTESAFTKWYAAQESNIKVNKYINL